MDRTLLRCSWAIILVLGLTLSVGLAEEAEGPEISWSPQWNVGDTFTLEMVKTSSSPQKGPEVDEKVSGHIEISVEEKGVDFYVLNYTLGKMEREEQKIYGSALEDFVSFGKEGMTLKLKTDEDGLPEEVLNLHEIIEKIQTALGLMEELSKDLLRANGAPEENIMQVRQLILPIRQLYSDTETAQRGILNDIRILFLCCAATMEEGDIEEIMEFEDEDAQLNLFQGEPVPPVQRKIQLENFDRQSGIADVEVERKRIIDPEKESIFFEGLKKMGSIIYGPSVDVATSMETSAVTKYQIDTKKGWPISVEHSREIKKIKANEQTMETERSSFKTIKMVSGEDQPDQPE